MRLRLGAAALLLALLPGVLPAADAIAILKLTVEQAGRPAYSATRIIELPSRRVVVRVFWAKPGVERQEIGAGEGRLLYVRNGEQAWYSGGHLSAGFSASYQEQPNPLSIPLLIRNYRVRLLTTSAVAGRTAYCLLLSPMLADRPARRLWVDRATGLILRQDVLSEGKIAFTDYFSAVHFGQPLPETLFKPPANAQPARMAANLTLSELESKLGRKLLLPHRLPPGFVLAQSRLVSAQGRQYAHLSYTDGLCSLSLFEMPAADKPADARAAWLIPGEVVDLLTWTSGGMHLTLAGDLPESQLRDIAGAVR